MFGFTQASVGKTKHKLAWVKQNIFYGLAADCQEYCFTKKTFFFL